MVKEKLFYEGACCSLLRHILEKVSGSRQDSGRSRGRETVLKCLLNVAENND